MENKILKVIKINILDIHLGSLRIEKFKSSIDLKTYYKVVIYDLTRISEEFIFSNEKDANKKINDILKTLKVSEIKI